MNNAANTRKLCLQDTAGHTTGIIV